ncbi:MULTISPECIES: hypothetical protein [Deefgea]|uniref:Uncharacterized protein n=1 Tax=Deefgea chitinilytica TaxID=570276 RepID=A0ABS2CEA0_9NEIS|nr:MULTISPECIES: hypothetical protein [Deefgea]MBM5571793.1 hypothetical protein [Deefgea chitinilytica]MBM9889028.1 hypothetical protein [Deefgea sp. CFH1-16]
MITAFNLAGFFAAHAIWCVSDGEVLTPMFAYVDDHDKKMERLDVGGDLEKSVDYGKQMLESNNSDANDAVLLYDGRITINGDKIDAIIVEIRCYFSPSSKAIMAIPYKTAAVGDFRVFKPKLLQWDNCDDFSLDSAFESFFYGVDSHEKGSAVWDKAIDQSM